MLKDHKCSLLYIFFKRQLIYIILYSVYDQMSDKDLITYV